MGFWFLDREAAALAKALLSATPKDTQVLIRFGAAPNTGSRNKLKK